MHFCGKNISMRFQGFIALVSVLHFPWRKEHAREDRAGTCELRLHPISEQGKFFPNPE
jgi:hypothetical protein